MVDPVRPLVAIAGVEAIAGILVVLADLVAVLRGTQGLSGGGAGLAAAGVILWLLMALAVGLVWLGLFRRRSVARTPFLLVQAFALVLVPLFWGSDVLAYRVVGVALGALAVSGIVLGLRPSVRTALS